MYRDTETRVMPSETSGRAKLADPKILFKEASKTYTQPGASRQSTLALDRLDLSIGATEIISILGPTGCGKSTAMNMIAGFEDPSSGAVLLDGKAITAPGPDRAVVFQQASLFPWMTVLENIVLGVKCRGIPADVYMKRAASLLAAVKLTGFERHYPYQLSGGMQQRVQIARALISEPEVLLMDEPFGALDSQTRLIMQELVVQLWLEYRPTIVFITHDVGEAIFVSDRIVLMSRRPGKIKLTLDVTAPKPRNLEFLGSSEFVQLQSRLLSFLKDEVQS